MYKFVEDVQVSKNFKLSEFICKEGKKEVLVDYKTIEMIQKIRDLLDKPIYIVSAYRSPTYNTRIGGAKQSKHMLGKAIDFKVRGMYPEEIYMKIKKSGMLGNEIKGLGLYNTFVHVDTRDNPHERGYSFWNNITYK